VSGRFPLLTDENVPGPIVEGLRSRGWDVTLTVELFGQQSVDENLFEYAVQQGRTP
jgi:hypothetical protein